jgi:diguanylate cyclase (GGDEF)-like protein
MKGDDMQLTMILPWFPIILAVGIAGRMLGFARGLGVGLVCAMFWIMLVQATVGVTVWHDGWTTLTMTSGAIAIVAMGGWSGQCRPAPFEGETGALAHERPHPDARRNDAELAFARDSLDGLASHMVLFDNWLEEHRDAAHAWPAFGEFVRTFLYQTCRATHVHLYKLRENGEELIALHQPEVFSETERLNARQGIVGHVVTTGRPYIHGDPAQGELIESLAAQHQDADGPVRHTAWCFPVRQGTHRLGAVVVGHLSMAPQRHRGLMRTAEQLVSQWWCLLREAEASRSAAQRDPVSGLHTGPAFLRTAAQALKQSYHQGEPVAVVVVSIEGLRDLSDSGRWEVADDLVAEVAHAMRQKLRADDRVGRFDGTRLVMLLRRVDSELASLIVGQLMSRLNAIKSDTARWGTAIHLRCGVVGSGTETPELRTLVARALAQVRRARETNQPIATDLQSPRRTEPQPSASATTQDSKSLSNVMNT